MKSDSNENSGKKDERIEEARVVRKIVLTIFVILLIVTTGVLTGGYLYINSALQPVDSDNENLVDVSIPIGSSSRTIANILEENGLIKDAKIFRYYVKFKNEAGFQAGDYKLSPSMEIQEIIDHLKTGKVIKEALFTITIPEGKQLEEIASIIEKKTEHSKDEFLEKINDPEYIEELIELYPSILSEEILNESIRYPLEGYLYPATYDFFEEDPSIDIIIEKMLSQTELIVSTYTEVLEEQDMTVHELLTIASLIEEEATQQADRNKISSVFYNRMEINMPLQTDPTVLYALGQHQVQITYDDLEVDSPYNTYRHRGLPVGPIANAGETSIQAALNPAETSALYFYARPNGQVIFTSSLQEHNQVKNKYKHEWDEYKN